MGQLRIIRPSKQKRRTEALRDTPARPMPPEEFLEKKDSFKPAPAIGDWVMDTFVREDAPLYNPIHKHLRHARIGWLWTTSYNASKMNRIVGMAELGKPPSSLSRWGKARYAQQMREWFGPKPLDFIVTFDALYCVEASDLGWCAISEHEISHCGHKRHKRTNQLMYSRETGKPVLALRGHDVEEFVHIVERYGVGAAAGKTAAMVEAAKRAPLIGAADVAGACGTCMRKAA